MMEVVRKGLFSSLLLTNALNPPSSAHKKSTYFNCRDHSLRVLEAILLFLIIIIIKIKVIIKIKIIIIIIIIKIIIIIITYSLRVLEAILLLIIVFCFSSSSLRIYEIEAILCF